MNLDKLTPGNDVPNDVNVVIEIPAHSDPIKYEVDKDTGMIHVDRLVSTSMMYPCNYGYIPNTLSEDGDPVDVLVAMPFRLMPGSLIRCRPLAMLRMTDESGPDAKILAVPVDKVTPMYSHVKKAEDLGQVLLSQIEHFFTRYKELEKGKWAKVDGWGDLEEAQKEIVEGVERYTSEHPGSRQQQESFGG
ncbi:MAG: inorganic diphosphatase [Gammaproteobacteria bacterium]